MFVRKVFEPFDKRPKVCYIYKSKGMDSGLQNGPSGGLDALTTQFPVHCLYAGAQARSQGLLALLFCRAFSGQIVRTTGREKIEKTMGLLI